MKANPTTFYEPQNRELFDETAAEILTGVTTYHALSKEKKELLKLEFSERVLDYFDKLNIAPTLDNLLLHQDNLRKEISFQVEDEIQMHEEFLGLGKKAKARRAEKRAEKADSSSWSTQGNWSNSNPTTSNKTIASAFKTGNSANFGNRTGTGTTNPQWTNTITSILGSSAQVIGAINAGKQQNQQQPIMEQQGFFPDPEPRKPRVLGMEPVVGIAIIILILAVFGFLVWQISQKQ